LFPKFYHRETFWTRFAEVLEDSRTKARRKSSLNRENSGQGIHGYVRRQCPYEVLSRLALWGLCCARRGIYQLHRTYIGAHTSLTAHYLIPPSIPMLPSRRSRSGEMSESAMILTPTDCDEIAFRVAI